MVHVGNERLARRVLAETAKARGEVPSTPQIEAATELLQQATAAVTDAEQSGMPGRMLRALQKREADAKAALDAARAEARAAVQGLPSTSPPPSPPPSPGGCCGGGGTPASRPPLTLASPVVKGWSEAGSSALWVLLDGEIAAACQLSDEIRSETRSAIASLGELGVRTTMLTGDADATAQAVRQQAGITEAVSGMKPAEKLKAIQAYREASVVGMIGDGVNDAPALAAADVSIAMGVDGTAMAAAAAGVVFMSNDLRRVADVVYGARLATFTLRISIAVSLALKLLPLVLIFTVLSEAEGYLIAAAVGSDVLGIAIVLAAALNLMNIKAKYAAAPCDNNASSLEGPAVISSTEKEHV